MRTRTVPRRAWIGNMARKPGAFRGSVAPSLFDADALADGRSAQLDPQATVRIQVVATHVLGQLAAIGSERHLDTDVRHAVVATIGQVAEELEAGLVEPHSHVTPD